MLKPNNGIFNDTLFSESMKSNKKKAMIVGTYHLMLGPAAKEMISGLSDRMVQFVTGMTNIRDVIPFPRYPKNAAF